MPDHVIKMCKMVLPCAKYYLCRDTICVQPLCLSGRVGEGDTYQGFPSVPSLVWLTNPKTMCVFFVI